MNAIVNTIFKKTYLVGVGSETEVLDSLTGVLGATEEDDVGTGWCAEGELVECDGLTTGLLNAGTGSCGELERADAELGELEETVVIGDGTDNGADLALVDLGGVLVGGDGDDLGERHWWGVDARHTQSVVVVVVRMFLPPWIYLLLLIWRWMLRTSSRRWH